MGVLGLGGTIAMGPVADHEGVAPHLTAAALVAAVPGLDEIADVAAESVRMLPGASLGFADVVALVETARARVDAGARGIVVTQGTDSLEETAYAFDLLWDRPEPLVVTGAMRPASAAGADGPANLLAAVAVAVAPDARQRGCLVVFAGQIFSASDVVKAHSTSPSAFRSPNTGPLGSVDEAVPRFTTPPGERLPPLEPSGGEPPSVALVTALLGDSGRQLEAIADAGFQGLVLAAMGAGHVPALLVGPLADAVTRMPVVATTRTGSGRLLHETYGFPGSERDLHRIGLLDGGALAPVKARVLLTLALWSEPDRAGAESRFRLHASAV
ncbi:MAG TPA: asparaginase [Baekduia sp.]|uniref:asparaginase n=1 Tax=Baekduia sp. TaxID=2600305 RepID=UPI002CE757B4|nr:asparaginase [Baekduia sp.]HMJ35586.1 asparaginase [Baekduia sp.]